MKTQFTKTKILKKELWKLKNEMPTMYKHNSGFCDKLKVCIFGQSLVID